MARSVRVSGNELTVMNCLSYDTIVLANYKILEKSGGFSGGIKSNDDIEKLAEYVIYSSEKYKFDEFECLSLAVYQIVKNHLFWDGNKRTAMSVLLNCLRGMGYFYTDRPKDLANKIIEIASSPSRNKEDMVRDFSYFIKARLQKKT